MSDKQAAIDEIRKSEDLLADARDNKRNALWWFDSSTREAQRCAAVADAIAALPHDATLRDVEHAGFLASAGFYASHAMSMEKSVQAAQDNEAEAVLKHNRMVTDYRTKFGED